MSLDIEAKARDIINSLGLPDDGYKAYFVEVLREAVAEGQWRERDRAEKAESERGTLMIALSLWEKGPPDAQGCQVQWVNDLRAERDALAAKLKAAQDRLDRTFMAALRYESRHDLDPERAKLWGDLKMALMVEGPGK